MANNTTKTLPPLTVEQADRLEDAIYEMESLFAGLETLPIEREEPHITLTMVRAIVREGLRQATEALDPLHEAKISRTSRALSALREARQ